MIRFLIYSLLSVIFVVPSASAEALMIDHEYDADLVKLACLPKMEPGCADNLVRELTLFENAIRASLAQEQRCDGLTIVSSGEPREPYWDLLVDYNSKAFRLIRVNDPRHFSFHTEAGTPPVIAEKVCLLVGEKRATQNSN